MTIIIVLLLAFGLIVLLRGKTPVTIKSHWQTFLDNCQISTDEFYNLVKSGLRDRKITKVDVAEESFLEKHIFSAKRLYLRVTQGEYVFYICSAPYGTGTFVSTWLCVKDEKLANKIPVLSKLAGKDRGNKTFYQMDTEQMFRSAVHTTVVAAVEGITELKGTRGLTELERQFIDVR